MRIQSLQVGVYGKFRNLDLTFPGEGVQLIWGPNEAGKTTLLEFVRELLFGFHERTPYAFGAASGKIEGEATLVRDDGSTVSLRRRKGRKNTVSGRVETPDGAGADLDESGFTAMLGGASANLFRSVFAFGLDELAAGERSLAEQGVKSVLFGAGASGGGVDPNRVLESLDADARRLYTDGSRKLEINNLLIELTDLSKQVKSKSIRCDAYEQRRRDLEAAQGEAERLGRDVRDAARDLDRRRKLMAAHAPWRELAALRRERSGLSAPEGFPADGLVKFDALEAETVRLVEDQEKNRLAVEKAERDLAALQFDPRPIERKPHIEGLNRAIDAVEQARRQIPEDRLALATAFRDAEERLAGLVPGWSLNELRRFRLTAERRERFDRLMEEREAKQRGLNELSNRRAALLESIAERQAELDALGDPIDVAPWAVLVQEADAYTADVQECRRRRAEHRRLQREAEEVLVRLSPPLADPTLAAAKLPAPPREAVIGLKQEFQKLRARIDAAEAGLRKDEAGCEALEREVAALSGEGGDLPSRDVLDAMRQGRDAGWDLVRRKYVDHRDVEAEIHDWLADHPADAADLIDAYPEQVRRTDRYADALFRHSTAVAKQEQLHTLADRIRRDREALGDLRSDLEALVDRWRRLWAGCGFEPLDPEAMEAWLDRLEDLRSIQAQLIEQEQEGRLVRDRIDDYERRLQGRAGESGDGATLLAVVRERERTIRDIEKSRTDGKIDLRRLQEKLARVEAELDAMQGDEEEWKSRRLALLSELNLPQTWDLPLLDRVLQDLNAAASALQGFDDRATRMAAAEERLAEFEPKVRELVEAIAPELADALPERAVAELHERLTASLSARERRAALEAKRSEAHAETVRCTERLERLAEEREAFLTAADAATADAFREVAARAARIAELDRAIIDKSREFDRLRDVEPLEPFTAELAEADVLDLEAACEDAQARHERARAEKSAADQAVGSRRRDLDEYERGDGDAAEIQGRIAGRRAELAALVDRYVPLVFAQKLLKQAVDRFEQDARPEMLQETSRLFSVMTDGRYVQVERLNDDEAPLQVRRFDGEVLEPHQLSAGTREQLYLAVRLAYVLHYCGRAESLPIVMDDVLANFDEDRARRTLRALGEISRRVQILFLTCHPHIVSLGREVFPLTPAIRLPASSGKAGDATTEAAPAAESSRPARPSKARRQQSLLDSPPSH